MAAGDPAALRSAVDLVVYVYDSGRWDLCETLYQCILDAQPAAAPSPVLNAQLTRLDLAYARACRSMGRSEQARDILLRHCDGPEKAAALMYLTLAYDGLGDWEECMATCEKCREVARELGDDDLEAFALWYMGAWREHQRDFTAALAEYEKIFALDAARRRRAGGWECGPIRRTSPGPTAGRPAR